MPILNDYSRDKDIRKDTEQYLIMGYIVFQMVGYTCLGWLVDKGFVEISNYVAANSLCMGLACCAMRFSSSFVALFLATAAFSTFLAALSSSVPTLVYEFIGKSLQSMAISSALVLLAPLSFSIAPLIGYFRGNLGSYDGGMYLMTAICVGCAVLIFMLPHIQKCGEKKKDNLSAAEC
ncbi:hypothetical protein JTE90_026811 [Oedothorax gibbosus]|uniref:Uncharacterized protein n=1 Tax=Oedothorax gibbosus TaxID=931172 RepID=A0AAV6V820_9ARAC|nr:hypothetical protein JTE90_026811 [Oedothorax gibbosus]